MSSFVLSKLDIDVLMHLAVHGPIGARFWEPLTDDPDGLGRAIWQQNVEAAASSDEECRRSRSTGGGRASRSCGQSFCRSELVGRDW